MLLFLKWVRGEMNQNKAFEDRAQGDNPTIGGGGGNGGAKKIGRSRGLSELDSHISHGLSNEGYAIQEVGGIVKSTELVVKLGVPPGSRGGDGDSLC